MVEKASLFFHSANIPILEICYNRYLSWKAILQYFLCLSNYWFLITLIYSLIDIMSIVKHLTSFNIFRFFLLISYVDLHCRLHVEF